MASPRTARSGIQWAGVGMLIATIALHLAGVGIGLALRRHSVWWPRVVGGLTALLGGAFLLHLV